LNCAAFQLACDTAGLRNGWAAAWLAVVSAARGTAELQLGRAELRLVCGWTGLRLGWAVVRLDCNEAGLRES